MSGKTRSRLLVAASLMIATTPAVALKYAARQHHIEADSRIAMWKPGPLVVRPEEELHLVCADTWTGGERELGASANSAL